MRLFLLTALLAVSTAASAAQPSADSAKKAPEQKVLHLVCKLEKPMGSQMLKRRCYTQEQMEADREAALRTMNREQNGIRN